MSSEGMRTAGSEQEPFRVQKEGAQKRAIDRDHFESARLESLGQELRELEERIKAASNDILQYEVLLTEGGKHIYQGSEKLKQLALELDTATREKQKSRQEERDGLKRALKDVERKIVEAGGNPAAERVQ